jgi:hypothetical protein
MSRLARLWFGPVFVVAAFAAYVRVIAAEIRRYRS